MLMLVRRFVRFFWGMNALAFFSLVFGTSRFHQRSLAVQTPAMKIGFIVLGAVFAIAWITNLKAFRAEAASRYWGLAASGLFLLEGLAVLLRFGTILLPVAPLPILLPILVLILVPILIGGAGLAAFAVKPKQPAAAATAAVRPRIAGDRTSRLTDRLIAGAATLLQIGAMVFWGIYARDHQIDRHSQVPYLAWAVLAALFAALTHECGHAIAGWIFDMRLLSFNAGPFTWRKKQGVWGFTFKWAGLFSGGGAVNVVPTHKDQPGSHEVCMVLAGPLVNLWLGIGLAAALLVPDKIDPDLRILFELMATYSLLAAIHNLMPFRLEEGAYSDGATILQIATRSPMVDVRRALNGVQSTLVTERRPRDLNIATIERAAAVYPKDLAGMHLRLCGMQHYHDAGEKAQAAAWLAQAEAMVEQHAIAVPLALHTSFIVNHALINQDAAAVTRWFDRMEKKSAEEKKLQKEGVDFWLAHASLLWMQGRIDEAKQCLDKAEAHAKSLPKVGAYEYDRSQCEQMRGRLEVPKQTTTNVAPPPMPAISQPAQAVPSVEEDEVDWSVYYTEKPKAASRRPGRTPQFEPMLQQAASQQAPMEPAALLQPDEAQPAPVPSEQHIKQWQEPAYRPSIEWPRSLGRRPDTA